MSMSTAAEVPASAPEGHGEQAPQSPGSETVQTAEPIDAEQKQAKSSSPSADVSSSPPSTTSESDHSESQDSNPKSPSVPQRESEATDKVASADQTQPPLPNEPLPDEDGTAPPLPNEPLPSTDPAAPPLPAEPVPEPEDDGWEFHWNPNDQSYWFYNRFTGVWQQENPRVPNATTVASNTTTTTTATASVETKTALSNPTSIAGGYNPAIHGDYDENAWYAQNLRAATDPSATGADGSQYVSEAYFNRRTGQWQAPDLGPERHSDEAKSRRQLRAYFDVDAAANMHDGRSLKAERAGKKPTKAELKAFKEKRRLKKEEKRRAWLRD
ncbi:hypothetical protein VTK56DRAFT_9276 [Thermocarpiscus australiensis]